jgi:periplasmic divalent cation tolerance protein
MDLSAVIVLVTVPESFDAGAMARTLVEERLAACVNVLPAMTSVYRWEDQVEEATERQIVIKTARDSVSLLQERVHDLHPYDVPEFLVIDVAGGADRYLSWLRDAVS